MPIMSRGLARVFKRLQDYRCGIDLVVVMNVVYRFRVKLLQNWIMENNLSAWASTL
jgi:hypothetical protein